MGGKVIVMVCTVANSDHSSQHMVKEPSRNPLKGFALGAFIQNSRTMDFGVLPICLHILP